jgi:HEAT repeat protein
MNEKKNNISSPSAWEIVNKLREDPVYMAKNSEREKRRDALAQEFARQGEPIVSDLVTVGFIYSSIDDLRRSGVRYEKAVPVLVKWLALVTNQALKESIVRALSVPWARPVAALPLIAEFKATKGLNSDSLKWAIGNALSIVADDSVFPEIAELVADKRHGKAREMLAVALGNMKNPQATDLAIQLLNDETVVGHALTALAKLKSERARPYIEAMADHPKPWVRKEAKKALVKFEK